MSCDLPKTHWYDFTLFRVVTMALMSLVLLLGCYDSGFTSYDDSMHVSQNEQITEMSPLQLFEPIPVSTYFPITLLSYQLDRAVFHDSLGWKNWATGVRLMTWLYHLGAALLLWRFLLRMGIARNAAFLVALIFAIHPLASETVCWTSERKNALAAFFGFGALYCWNAAAAYWCRMPLVCTLYGAALLSKPSALGLLPVFMVLDIFYGPAGKLFTEPLQPLKKRWLGMFARTLPLLVLSAIALKLNLKGHEATLVAPPGGSSFTALLTDMEIGSRYLLHWIAPVGLSAVYLVEPICGLNDWRVLYFGVLLISLFGVTFWLAADRRLLVFSWLWMVGALGPNLNLVAIPHFMQDRYIYLSTPAFFLILWQVLEGLRLCLGSFEPKLASPQRILICAYFSMLLFLSAQRSFIWNSTYSIFLDAVEKQPRAAYARFGLGMAYGQAAEVENKRPRVDRDLVEKYSSQWIEHWRAALDSCPDVSRFSFYTIIALNVGEERKAHNDWIAAEKYWTLAAYPPPETPVQAPARALALGWLASLRMSQNRLVEAHTLAQEAVLSYAAKSTVGICIRATTALAEKEESAGHTKLAQELREEVLTLQRILARSKQAPKAEKILR